MPPCRRLTRVGHWPASEWSRLCAVYPLRLGASTTFGELFKAHSQGAHAAGSDGEMNFGGSRRAKRGLIEGCLSSRAVWFAGRVKAILRGRGEPANGCN